MNRNIDTRNYFTQIWHFRRKQIFFSHHTLHTDILEPNILVSQWQTTLIRTKIHQNNKELSLFIAGTLLCYLKLHMGRTMRKCVRAYADSEGPDQTARMMACAVRKQNHLIQWNVSMKSKCPDVTLRICFMMWIRMFSLDTDHINYWCVVSSWSMQHLPADTWRLYNVDATSWRCIDGRRSINVMCLLGCLVSSLKTQIHQTERLQRTAARWTAILFCRRWRNSCLAGKTLDDQRWEPLGCRSVYPSSIRCILIRFPLINLDISP